MKTLYIVRHGKSSWENPGLADHERPLLQKGVKRTLKIANYLNEKRICPDLMISSHAVRAYDTARIIAGIIAYPEDDIVVSKNLYHGSGDGILDELFSLDDSIESVMIFGHNPTFTSFANHFLKEKIDWLPTSGVVAVQFDVIKWSDIPLARVSIDFVVYPKHL
jgi:phosphohistidine phosphatase